MDEIEITYPVFPNNYQREDQEEPNQVLENDGSNLESKVKKDLLEYWSGSSSFLHYQYIKHGKETGFQNNESGYLKMGLLLMRQQKNQ